MKIKISKYLPQIIATLFLAGFVAYAWTEPSVAPPGENVDAPINVGITSQTKQGDLIINPGKVGIGTASPQGLLDVNSALVITKEANLSLLSVETSYQNPSTGVDAGGGGAVWSTPQNIAASDNLYANSSANSGNSNFLKATGFNFSIPNGSQIEGIEVEIEGYYYCVWPGCFATLNSVRLLKNNVSVGTTKNTSSFNLNIEANYFLGNVNDVWGESWTANDINNSNFGVVFQAFLLGSIDGDGDTHPAGVRLDNVQIKISYRPPIGGESGVAKMGQATIYGDGRISTNLNADKLDNLHASEIGKTALNGRVELTYSTAPCGISTSLPGYPVTCSSLPPGQCAIAGTKITSATNNVYNCNWYGPSCPSGYQFVTVFPLFSNSGTPNIAIYTCYKNP
ncbi:MAG: hypothetical protein Q7R84_03645 [bacterium]|nr:hypothetical protein [bacterium]